MTEEITPEQVAAVAALVPLQAKLLKVQTRKETAEAKAAELSLAAQRDSERDRLAKTPAVRHLRINGTITEASVEKWIGQLQHWERRDPGQPITIDINSPGGSVTDGFALYDQIMRMRRMGHEVTIRGVGIVASMAAVVLQAGSTRALDARCKVLIHEGSSVLMGNFSRGEQEDMRVFSDMLLNDVRAILAERSTLSERQIQNRWKRKDWWLSADEAVKLGFADRVE